MLDRQKLMSELVQLTDSLFKDYSADYQLVIQAWQRAARDATFVHRVRAVNAPWPVPSWQGRT